MGEKSKADPEYAKITSGVLSGMIFPNQEAAAKALLGTLEEAAVSTGVRTAAEALNDPFKVPQSAANAAKIGFQLVSYAAQDPFAALKWGMDAGVNLLGIISAELSLPCQNGLSKKKKKLGRASSLRNTGSITRQIP